MLRTAARLLRRQGYAATGWRQVVAESGTPWGSQAHHFPGGKAQLAAEGLQHAAATYDELLRRVLARYHPADAITRWADAAAAELAASGWADGCPVATVALETAHASDRLAEACATAFDSWQRALGDAMRARGASDAEADGLAALILAGMEGALLLARAHRDPAPLHVVGQQLSEVVKQRIP
jgi:TetR/AcrR family transcriptional regulator, lmrAB and yxaGH operons repressor